MTGHKRVLVINGHPDPASERLCSALAAAYLEGARAAGTETRRIDIGALSFPFLRTSEAFAHAPSHPDIQKAREDMLWANHLVFVYPLWLGGPPAMLKAFMEWVGCGEFLLGLGKGPLPKGKLAGRTARVVVTMGMPSLIYRLFFRAHGTLAFEKSILRMAGIRRVRTTYIGNVGVSAGGCRRWIARMGAFGAKIS